MKPAVAFTVDAAPAEDVPMTDETSVDAGPASPDQAALAQQRRELIGKYLTEGDSVYELFAVLVHQGAHDSGHYFAYVKSFEDGEWYKFNDREVLQVPERTVETAFGRKYSDASAYLLQYRRVHSRLDPSSLNTKRIPPEFEAEIKEQGIALIKEQSEIYENMLKLPLTIYLDVD